MGAQRVHRRQDSVCHRNSRSDRGGKRTSVGMRKTPTTPSVFGLGVTRHLMAH